MRGYTVRMYSSARVAVCTLTLALFPFFAFGATLSLDPDGGAYGPGDTFIASVRLDNEGACINAAHVEVSYSPENLRAVDFSRGGSIFSLWVEEPLIDTEKGTVIFSGGIPGGYCGRIPGDPALSNVLGRVIFTVVTGDTKTARVRLAPSSVVYVNDGQGTELKPAVRDATYTLSSAAQGGGNPWLQEVADDVTPPDPFAVQIESTRDVFGGMYYIVFSTIDKQSGLDHYEIFERGVWKRISSPYKLGDQLLRNVIEVKAIDKAGNERLGTYTEGSPPPRQTPYADTTVPLFVLGIVVLLGGVKLVLDRRKKRETRETDDVQT